MRTLPVLIFLLASSLLAQEGQPSQPDCALPFEDIATEHNLGQHCAAQSETSSSANALQNQAKNNFCAQGPPAPEHTPCPECKYEQRGDRSEGIGGHQVSGARFGLLSVEILPAGKVATGGDQVHLWFRLPQKEKLIIDVWEPDSDYWMVPEPRVFPAGLQSYAWPRSEVLARLRLDLASLRPKIRNHDETLYYPALVTTSSRPEPGDGYVFVFRSSAGIDVTCTVLRDEGGKLTPVRTFPYSKDSGGLLRIPWNGLDDHRKPVPNGVYVLRLDGKRLAATNRTLTFNLSFLHHGTV